MKMKISFLYKGMLYSYLLIKDTLLCAAVFTIINHTGGDIRVKLLLNKSWGSKSIERVIKKDFSYQFNTGVYALIPNGITWEDLSSNSFYYLAREGIVIDNPLMMGGFIRLYKDEKNIYRYEFKLNGRSGWGPVSIVDQ